MTGNDDSRLEQRLEYKFAKRAFLELALKRKWVNRELDSRALSVTKAGRREMQLRFGLPDTDAAS